ncbi:MAG: hypothetical protein EOO09_15825 [Chitinophagaceae bacterium]|nr:MAG: hypothetical protein EOO09_15825 [Chitinophagaceae bacterium]
MKLRLLATAILLFIHSALFSQSASSRWEIEVRTGLAIPQGDFADKELVFNPTDIRLKGRAKTGYSANIGASYKIKGNVGLLLVAGLTSNKQDEDAHKEGPNLMGDPYTEDINTNSWNIGKLMTGAWLQTSPGKGDLTQLRFRAIAGVCQSSSPAFSYVRVDNPDDPSRRQIRAYSNGKYKLEPSFCYEGGVQFIRKISRPVAVSAGAGYFHSVMKDRTRIITPNLTEIRKWDYNTSIITVELGLHLSLGH